MSVTRREFIRATATAGGIATLAGVASASHPDSQPDHVTLEYDAQTLKRYRPLLVLRELDVRPLALHGWVARSPEHETDICCYWAEYTHQDGVSDYDSHWGDHEPIYVTVDSDTGDVSSILYSGYHWLAARTTAPPLYNDTHPKLHVVSPWHHYFTTTEEGMFVDLADLTDSFSSWRANGLESSLKEGTVTNPWVMNSRGHWWQDTAAGLSLNALYVRALLSVGFHDAERTDLK